MKEFLRTLFFENVFTFIFWVAAVASFWFHGAIIGAATALILSHLEVVKKEIIQSIDRLIGMNGGVE